jgi:hypothetical protein
MFGPAGPGLIGLGLAGLRAFSRAGKTLLRQILVTTSSMRLDAARLDEIS